MAHTTITPLGVTALLVVFWVLTAQGPDTTWATHAVYGFLVVLFGIPLILQAAGSAGYSEAEDQDNEELAAPGLLEVVAEHVFVFARGILWVMSSYSDGAERVLVANVRPDYVPAPAGIRRALKEMLGWAE
jgi:hypothetical protein